MLLSCVHRPPPSPPSFARNLPHLPHLPAAMVIRTGGTAGSPPPPATHTPNEHLETSVLDLCDGLNLEVMSMGTDIGQ
jgi:hypothetical protein